MIDLVKEVFERLIAHVELKIKRGLYSAFKPGRLTGLVGPRGVGKTTLLLQYIKEHLYSSGKVFYFSADAVYFRQTTLLEFVDYLYKYEGCKFFFIDEIHQYANWVQEIKNIYDSYPDIRVVFSGSSMSDLIQGSYDLSRRVHMVKLPGLSFREYLLFTEKVVAEPISFNNLIEKPKDYSYLGGYEKILAYFQDYLTVGYYPFFLENEKTYCERVGQIVKKIIFEDIPNRYDLKTGHLHLFHKLLVYLASIPPGESNIQNIAKNIGLAHQTTAHYLHILAEMGLIQMIYPFEGGATILRKPAKIFLHNTTLLFTMQSFLGTQIQKGTLREIFFLQCLRDANQTIFYSKQGDYRVLDWIFEIGGKNKTGKQIGKIEGEGFLVKDGVLLPTKNSIPLFYFGFLL